MKKKSTMTFDEILDKMQAILDKNNGLPTDNFYKAQEAIIKKNNPEFAYKLALKKWNGLDRDRLAQIVINSKDPRWNYWYARDIEGADIFEHGYVVIRSADPQFNCWFAQDIDGANIEVHARVVINSRDPKWNFEFAREVEGADILAHGRAVMDSRDPYWNLAYARDLAGADIMGHWQVVKEFGSEKCILEFQQFLNGIHADTTAIQ